MSTTLKRIYIMLVTLSMFVTGNIRGVNHVDLTANYIKAIESVEFFENTIETAVPQTDIYKIVNAHFSAPLPEGKKEKKAIVIGYDGCRLDNFALVENEEKSAVKTLINDGGQAVISYCGGVNYPEKNTQKTSTAPGWCSMLTGKWADEHHIKRNHVPKSNKHLTMLTTLVKDGIIDDSAFYVSWKGHFNNPFSTYWYEKKYVKKKNIDTTFLYAKDDNGTIRNVMKDIEQADCTDFIFSILEYCDHTGHKSGYGLNNPKYTKAFNTAEEKAYDIIEAIKSRETFADEDWLILLTTDHGGYNDDHGKATLQERMTYIVSNKDLDYKF